MAFIPVYQSLPGHKFMIRLRLATGAPVAHLTGHLVCLWLWALDNARDGVLPGEAAIIADAARWEGDADAWLSALLHSGFVALEADGQLTIHDWDDYVGNYFDALERHRDSNRQRQARFRDRHRGENARNVRDNVTPSVIVTPLTLRNALTVDHTTQQENTGEERGGNGRARAPEPAPAHPRANRPTYRINEPEAVGWKRPTDLPRTLPDDFALDDEMRAWAAANVPAVDAESQTAVFVRKRRSKGYTSCDWLADWEGWMFDPIAKRDSQARASPNGHSPPGGPQLTSKTEQTMALYANFDPTKRHT